MVHKHALSRKYIFNVRTYVSNTKKNVFCVKIDNTHVDIDDFGNDIIAADIAKGTSNAEACVLSINIRGSGVVLFGPNAKRDAFGIHINVPNTTRAIINIELFFKMKGAKSGLVCRKAWFFDIKRGLPCVISTRWDFFIGKRNGPKLGAFDM